ncbi:MAG: HNH endonuclease [Pseudomonadota bacterium]
MLHEKLLDCRRQITEAREKIKSLEEKMQSVVLRVPQDKFTKAIASILYWEFPEIKTATLAEKLGIKGFFSAKKHVEPYQLFICNKCEYAITASTKSKRTEIKRLHREGNLSCPNCAKENREERTVAIERIWKEREERFKALKTMPYAEYLQSPEWQARRIAHLKSSKFSCQVCNKKDTPLNVHHRTYENKGNERWGDLITLCQDCHKTFHGKR